MTTFHPERLLPQLGAIVLMIASAHAFGATLNFSGSPAVIASNTGTGIYAGASAITIFSGFIDDISGDGSITDGTTATPVTCCVVADVVTVRNDVMLDADEVDLLNALAGFDQFQIGVPVDGIDIEGDTMLPGGGRLEIGLSWVFAASAFDDDDPENYPFAPNVPLLALFFILEEDADGNDVFDLVGRIQPVPLPPALVLFAGASAVMLRRVRTRRRNR